MLAPLSRHRFVSGTAAALAAAPLLAKPRAAAAMSLPPAKIDLGTDVFLRETWHELRGRTVGLVTNQTGVNAQLESTADAIRRNAQIALKALYAPEHGLRGDRPAGAYVPSYTDPRSGLPVYSLYGPTRKPTPAMLSGIDVLLFDIQDLGYGAYTYISTMAYVMQAAKENGKEVWILDRPNPVGGELVEGPVTEPQYATFVRLYPIAMRYAMTVGELAQLFNEEFKIGAQLRVVQMRNWKRSMFWNDTGLQWVQTSPNVPHAMTAVVIPATGLIAGMGINNGTDYSRPFELAGAFGIDAQHYADYLNARPIPGVHFSPTLWSPFGGFWKDKELSGVSLDVFDPRSFTSVRTAVELLVAMRSVSPQTIVHEGGTTDRDWGTNSVRLGVNEGASVDAIVRGWQPRLDVFKAQRLKYLQYS